MMFFEVCEHDSHKETILNISHKLFVARQEEQIANQMAQKATQKRMKIEEDLCNIVGIVVDRNSELMSKVNGVHSSDESEVSK